MGDIAINNFRKKLLKSSTIGLDSAVFLYHFADHQEYAPLTTVIFELMEESRIHAITSMITVSEIFVHAEKEHNQLIIMEYENFLQTMPNLKILSIDWHMARLASMLRATYKNVRLPDALQLSAPLLTNYSLFVTNDIQLKNIKEIEVILLDEYL